MRIKFLNELDFVNYKLPSMFIGWPHCTGKCEGCQNAALHSEPDIEIGYHALIERYLNNPMSEAVCCGGLEPFDSWEELGTFVHLFREQSKDPIVIYTGYNENEIEDKIFCLSHYKNIIVKFGRFLPNQPHHFDEVLGVGLASPNQYAKELK